MQFQLTTTVTGQPTLSSVTPPSDDADASAFLGWAAEVYFPLGVLVTAADPTTTPPTAAVYRAPTNQELHDAAWLGIWNGMDAHIKDFKRRKIIADALAAAGM